MSVCVYMVNEITTPRLEEKHCPCLHTAVWLPTRVPAYCGPLENPTALGGFGALFFLGAFTHAVH